MAHCFIGLGSNMQQPRLQLQSAKNAMASLPQSAIKACSSIYQSKALTLDDEPQDDYLNAVIELTTQLEPEELLNALLEIELKQGRTREKRWGARTLDLDILLYDDEIIETDRLTIPHCELTQRNFVLVPLHEIAPNIDIPGKESLNVHMKRVGDTALKKVGEFDG